MVLIFKQPDLGTAILLMGIFLVMLYASGMAHRLFFCLLGIFGLLVPLAWHVLKPYQKDRLLVFLNPSLDPLGAGYTITQSKIAVGSGELVGQGLAFRHAEPIKFFAREAYGFYFFRHWRGMGAFGRDSFSLLLRHYHLLRF